MTNRDEIVRLLEAVYAARKSGDTTGILECFCQDGQFKAVGSAAPAIGRVEQAPAIGQLVDAFELLDYKIHKILVEGDMAAVHWHGRFRAKATGKIGETDLLDMVHIREGRIAAFHNFFDTALAQRLLTA
jgi:ketosteroid isomerase-like protein